MNFKTVALQDDDHSYSLRNQPFTTSGVSGDQAVEIGPPQVLYRDGSRIGLLQGIAREHGRTLITYLPDSVAAE